jgi:hypothetical protein
VTAEERAELDELKAQADRLEALVQRLISERQGDAK